MKDAVVIVIFTPGGEILLLKRSEQSTVQGWCLPGGHVEREETFRETATRELREETGISVHMDDLQWAGFETGSRGERVCVFWVVLPSQRITLSEEHTDYVWTKDLEKEDADWAGNTLTFIETAKYDKAQPSRLFR